MKKHLHTSTVTVASSALIQVYDLVGAGFCRPAGLSWVWKGWKYRTFFPFVNPAWPFISSLIYRLSSICVTFCDQMLWTWIYYISRHVRLVHLHKGVGSYSMSLLELGHFRQQAMPQSLSPIEKPLAAPMIQDFKMHVAPCWSPVASCYFWHVLESGYCSFFELSRSLWSMVLYPPLASLKSPQRINLLMGQSYLKLVFVGEYAWTYI